ncbi:unannotated protein [freshwater metagenome]|jgi:hypothetical protein|uniref:Unannotated protein n=1 Tax=freshwater metagenome TaxID=449393 RepID=A0A6J7C5P1_9ZZZZ
MLRNDVTRALHLVLAGWGLAVNGETHFAFSCQPGRVPPVPGEDTNHDTEFDEAAFEAAEAAMRESRERLAEVPAEVVICNHVMGLYELAAIHLSAEPPSLREAALAIDAVACLLEGLEGRLGADAETLMNALLNIRLAFVQIKNAQGG